MYNKEIKLRGEIGRQITRWCSSESTEVLTEVVKKIIDLCLEHFEEDGEYETWMLSYGPDACAGSGLRPGVLCKPGEETRYDDTDRYAWARIRLPKPLSEKEQVIALLKVRMKEFYRSNETYEVLERALALLEKEIGG